MTVHKTLALGVVAVGLLLATACSSTRTTSEQFDDGVITSKINAKLAADPLVNPFNVDVDTVDRRVTLRGEVEKESAKREAEELAEATAGVLSVRNEIRVVSKEHEDDERYSDSWIATKIKSKLAADPQVNPFDIDVDVEDGRVTLSGTVSKAVARSEAEQLARDTKGVVAVINELEVEG